MRENIQSHWKDNMIARIIWILLLWTAFLILVLQDWRNLKYIFKLFREFAKIVRKNSKYHEDDDFILIHKNYIKNRKKL